MVKFKLLSAILVIFIFSSKCFAVDSFYKNTLKEIDVKKAANNGYLINLIFDDNYTEPLSIIKKGVKKHSIILPETKISEKNVNVLYEIDKEKENVNLEVTEHPYIDQAIQNGYVKIIINTGKDLPVQVASDIEQAIPPAKISKNNIEIIAKDTSNLPELEVILPPPPSVEEDILATFSTMQKIERKFPIITKLKSESVTKGYIDVILKVVLIILVVAFCIRQLIKIIKSLNISVKMHTSQVNTFTPSRDKSIVNSKFKKELDQINNETKIQQGDVKVNLNDVSEKPVSTAPPTQMKTKTPAQTIVKTNPIEKGKAEAFAENPILVSHAKIAKDKGMYLVNYDDQYSLLGYIGDKFFALKTLDGIEKPKLQMRMNERSYDKATYLARVGDYKSLIEVSPTDMRVLTEF